MDEQALEMAMRRIALAREGRDEESRFEAALRRSREEVEALAAASSSLVAALPGRVSEAVEDGLRREVMPVARNLAEIRGLLNNAIGRLERLEQDLIAERNARLDDLALLVDLDLVRLAGCRRLRSVERASRDRLSLAPCRRASPADRVGRRRARAVARRAGRSRLLTVLSMSDPVSRTRESPRTSPPTPQRWRGSAGR